MSKTLPYYTVWGPRHDAAWAIVKVDEAGNAALVNWGATPQEAWAQARPNAVLRWGCSQWLADELDVPATYVADPQAAQAQALYIALREVSADLVMMGMSAPDEAVTLLRALARLQELKGGLQDRRAIALRAEIVTPQGQFARHLLLERNSDLVAIQAVAGKEHLRRSLEFSLSGVGRPDFDFELFYAASAPSMDWCAKAVKDITGTAITPQVFQFQDGHTLPLTGQNACVIAAIADGVCAAADDASASRSTTWTPRGVYEVTIDPVTL